jgi:peptide/nickel transport system substrate-binding protein
MEISRRTALLGAAGAAFLPRPAAAQVPNVPRARTLVIAQTFDPQTLWANGTTASDNVNVGATINESLLFMNAATNRMEPLLALGADQETPTTWRIRLRPNVRFTNGEPMDADAVVHSITVFADGRTTPAYASYAAPIERAEKVDDLTVRLTTKYPSPTVPLMLSQVYVIPPRYWAEAGVNGFGQRPIGTGPFVLVQWLRDNRVVMDKNPNYWGTAPANVDRVIWRPVPDENARAAGLETGEFDIATALSVPGAQRLAGARTLRILESPSYRIFHLTLSSLSIHPGPIQNRLVRIAMNHAIDKQAIIRNMFAGKARALSGQILRREQMGFDPSLSDYAFDQARARALLAEAGHPNGFETVLQTPSGRFPQDREVAEACAGMLARVGIRCRIEALESGEYLRRLRTRELAPIAYLGLAPPDDPDFQVGQYRSDWRYSYVQNPEFDRLIDAGRREMDVERRAAIYQELMRAMHHEAPVVWLFQGVDLHGTSSRVSGLAPRGDGRIALTGVSLAAR